MFFCLSFLMQSFIQCSSNGTAQLRQGHSSIRVQRSSDGCALACCMASPGFNSRPSTPWKTLFNSPEESAKLRGGGGARSAPFCVLKSLAVNIRMRARTAKTHQLKRHKEQLSVPATMTDMMKRRKSTRDKLMKYECCTVLYCRARKITARIDIRR